MQRYWLQRGQLIMQNHETVTDLDESEDGTVVKTEDAMQMA